jgi:hypothetical protein
LLQTIYPNACTTIGFITHTHTHTYIHTHTLSLSLSTKRKTACPIQSVDKHKLKELAKTPAILLCVCTLKMGTLCSRCGCCLPWAESRLYSTIRKKFPHVETISTEQLAGWLQDESWYVFAVLCDRLRP